MFRDHHPRIRAFHVRGKSAYLGGHDWNPIHERLEDSDASGLRPGSTHSAVASGCRRIPHVPLQSTAIRPIATRGCYLQAQRPLHISICCSGPRSWHLRLGPQSATSSASCQLSKASTSACGTPVPRRPTTGGSPSRVAATPAANRGSMGSARAPGPSRTLFLTQPNPHGPRSAPEHRAHARLRDFHRMNDQFL
jgi:hypothetical protein